MRSLAPTWLEKQRKQLASYADRLGERDLMAAKKKRKKKKQLLLIAVPSQGWSQAGPHKEERLTLSSGPWHVGLAVLDGNDLPSGTFTGCSALCSIYTFTFVYFST